MHFHLITWMSKKTLLILNSRNVLFSVTHTHKNTRTHPHKHLMWSQWGRRAAFSRCFFLIPICAHWRKQIIDTWVLGSDASSELINVSLIVAVVHCDNFVCVCVCVPGLWVPLYTCMCCMSECEWAHMMFDCKLLWMQLMMELYATRCNSLSDNYLRCTLAHRNLSFIPNYCFPEVEWDGGREGKVEEEIYALWRQRSTRANGS